MKNIKYRLEKFRNIRSTKKSRVTKKIQLDFTHYSPFKYRSIATPEELKTWELFLWKDDVMILYCSVCHDPSFDGFGAKYGLFSTEFGV